jgi:hypothetical protein
MEASSHLQRILRLIPPMLSAQRSSWEQGVAAQALLEFYRSSAFSGDSKPDYISYLYGLAHDACLRASTDGRLGTRLNSSDEGKADGSAVDPACIGETIWFLIDYLPSLPNDGHPPTAVVEFLRRGVDGMLKYLLHRAPRLPPTEGENLIGVERVCLLQYLILALSSLNCSSGSISFDFDVIAAALVGYTLHGSSVSCGLCIEHA